MRGSRIRSERRRSVARGIKYCTTPGCRNHQRFGDLCGTCAKNVPQARRESRDIRSTVYPTGETRRSDGTDQVEMTDGRQRWWVNAQVAA